MSAAASSSQHHQKHQNQSCCGRQKVGASNFSALIGLGGCDASGPGVCSDAMAGQPMVPSTEERELATK